MRAIILLLISAGAMFGQCGKMVVNPTTGQLDCTGGFSACPATPPTTGSHQTCYDTAGAIWTCTGTCTVAGDWVAAAGSGSFTALTGHATSTSSGGATDVIPFYEVTTLPAASAAVVGRLYRMRAATTKDVCLTAGDSGGSAVAVCVRNFAGTAYNVINSDLVATTDYATPAQLPASVTGIRKSAGAGTTDSAAAAADVYGLWSGTKDSSHFLAGDGTMQAGGSVGIAVMTTGAADPVASCTAPSTSNIALYTQTTSQDLWACVATNTWKKIISTTNSGTFVETGTMGTAPTRPSSGSLTCYYDSTDYMSICLDSGTRVAVMVKSGTARTANQFVTYVDAHGVTQTAAIAAADLPGMVGDSGSGGTKGAVPAPAAGDAAAGKFFKADGTFAIPPGTTGSAPYSCAVSGVSSLACTHNLGTSQPWVACYDASGNLLGGSGASSSLSSVVATSSSVATLTFSGTTTATCLISTGSMGPTGSTGATGSAGSQGPRAPCIIENDTQSATALTNAQITGRCDVTTDGTLAEIAVYADAGTPTVILERWRPNGGSAADLVSGTLATGSSGAYACAASGAACLSGVAKSGTVTLTNTSIAAGDVIRVKSAVAGGVATWHHIMVQVN